MNTMKRLYFYGMALVALVVTANGASQLLAYLLDLVSGRQIAGGVAERVSLGLALGMHQKQPPANVAFSSSGASCSSGCVSGAIPRRRNASAMVVRFIMSVSSTPMPLSPASRKLYKKCRPTRGFTP